MTKEELTAFEDDIAACYDKAMIRAPIHLSEGNEEEMIKIFAANQIGVDDYVFCTWRSHFQCLLKGVPPERLKADIIAGKSISLCYPEFKIFSSAIVTGSIPIAVGVAMGLKLSNTRGKVYVFVGDMGAETGSFYENFKYAVAQELPIKFIVEDNNKSVCTPTRETWGLKKLTWEEIYEKGDFGDCLYYYTYNSKWPHAGASKRVNF